MITIVDDGGGPQSDSLILYDEFAPKGLPTSTLHAVQMPDKRKVADKIAAAHGIRRRHEWGARRPKKVPVDQDWDYSTVVIHHSGDRGMKVPNQIQDYHMFDTSRLYDDIGYEYLVHPDGTIYEGRFLAYKSASNSSMNTGKIGICAMGDFEHQWWDPSNDVPSPEQLNSVKALVKTLKSQFPVTRLVGHHDLDPTKECPGSKLYELLDGIRFDTGTPDHDDEIAAPRLPLHLGKPLDSEASYGTLRRRPEWHNRHRLAHKTVAKQLRHHTRRLDGEPRRSSLPHQG